MKKNTDSISDFDFGFSFVEEEYEDVKNTKTYLEQENTTSKEQVEELQSRIDLLYNSIEPFLDNLSKNPEKSTILWPNRVEKIQEFKTRLKDIAEGNNI